MQERASSDLAMVIADDNSNKQLKRQLQDTFHQFRFRVNSSPMVRGELGHLLDDMYFGDSKYSVGIQLADICGFLIGRHLLGKTDTSTLYEQLASNIFKGEINP